MLTHPYGQQVGAGCFLGAQPQPGQWASDAVHLGLSTDCLGFLIVWWLHSKNEHPKRTMQKCMTFLLHNLSCHMVPIPIYFIGRAAIRPTKVQGEVGVARFQWSTWERRYYCRHLWKTQSATVLYHGLQNYFTKSYGFYKINVSQGEVDKKRAAAQGRIGQVSIVVKRHFLCPPYLSCWIESAPFPFCPLRLATTIILA